MDHPLATLTAQKIIDKGSKRWIEEENDRFGINLDILKEDICYEINQISEAFESQLKKYRSERDAQAKEIEQLNKEITDLTVIKLNTLTMKDNAERDRDRWREKCMELERKLKNE